MSQRGLHIGDSQCFRTVTDPARTRRFEQTALPHLDAAYNLARWLVGSDADARDVVQDAYLRAFRYFDGYAGGDPRSWLLAIVRNASFSWLGRNRPGDIVALDDDARSAEVEAALAIAENPESAVISRSQSALLDRLIAALPAPFREVIVLREIEELSYREIAAIADIPVGTVMSRLARARRQLQRAWQRNERKDSASGL